MTCPTDTGEPGPVVVAQSAADPVEAVPTVPVPVPDPQPVPVPVPVPALSACAVRDRVVAEYIRTHPGFDSVMLLMPYGEVIYIEWTRRVIHVSGPRCEEL